jgi:hypothetical protein
VLPVIVAWIAFTTRSFFAGLILVFCALTFYYFAVLRIDYAKTSLLDLSPSPDAPEYFAQAKALLKRWMAFDSDWL